MQLNTWAKKWGVNELALEDLKRIFGIAYLNVLNDDEVKPPLSEAAVMNIVRVEASKKNCRLWRNNIGAVHTFEGNFIRYGLANESTGMNRVIKSADLIGIRPVSITQEMVGTTIGQFVSREIKKSDWSYSATEREQAQLRWANLISALGGDACFATGEGTL